MSVEELHTRTGTDRDLLAESLTRLEDRGLIARRPDRPVRYTALPPEHAVEVLLLARERDIRQMRLLVERLTERHGEARTGQDSASLIEVITGADGVARCGQQLFRRAENEIRGIDAPPYAEASDGERVNSSRLVGNVPRMKMRFIHGRDALARAGEAARVQEDVDAGEEVRFLPTAPMKLIIADDQVALLPLVTTSQVLDSCILVHPSALLDALSTLFETLWAQAQPYVPHQSHVDGSREFVSEEERQIVSLLALGLSDEMIARQLGIGHRTVQRRAQALMARLGAASRFQAGLLAAKRGWWA